MTLATILAVGNIAALGYLGYRANQLSRVAANAQLLSVLWSEYDRVQTARMHAQDLAFVPFWFSQRQDDADISPVYGWVAEYLTTQKPLPVGIDDEIEKTIQKHFWDMVVGISEKAWASDKGAVRKRVAVLGDALTAYYQVCDANSADLKGKMTLLKTTLAKHTKRR